MLLTDWMKKNVIGITSEFGFLQVREDEKVQLVTDVAPADQAEEVAVCQEQPGGILTTSVFDAQGNLVNSSLIEVF